MQGSHEPVLKPQRVFTDNSPAYRSKRRAGYRAMFADCARFPLGGFSGKRVPAALPFSPHVVAARFCGMNVAASPDADGDAIQIAALKDLAVGAVRIDYGTHADRAPADRLIEALLAAGFALTLHIVQDPDQASKMDNPATQREWRGFLEATLDRYAARIEALEVGSTPNRHSWSGYTPIDYAIAARVACEALDGWASAHCAQPRPLLLGPNISDFAPYFTVGQLAACHRQGVRFDVMTDNLFIDRAGEPERYDAHVFGNLLASIPRMDMVRKQRILSSLAARFGTSRSWCTYTHYTLNFGRVRARYISEDQYANYMLRSHILTAAAGCFERYYWGTLVSHYKGLIDEGIRVRPYPPYVHHRFATLGASDMWRRRDGFFRAYSTMSAWLGGARFVRRWAAPSYVQVLEFEAKDGTIVAGWTRDGRAYSLDLLRSPLSRPADMMIDREGNALPSGSPIALSETPIYWRYGLSA